MPLTGFPKKRTANILLPPSKLYVLKAARVRRRLDSKDVARTVGVTPHHIRALERGSVSPSYPLLRQWAAAVGVSVDLILTPQD